jgi:hypothetical protein
MQRAEFGERIEHGIAIAGGLPGRPAQIERSAGSLLARPSLASFRRATLGSMCPAVGKARLSLDRPRAHSAASGVEAEQ